MTASGRKAATLARSAAPVPPTGTSAADAVYRSLFDSFGPDSGDRISPLEVLARLDRCGLRADDPRIAEALVGLAGKEGSRHLSFAQFKALARHNSSLIRRAVEGDLAVPDFAALSADIERMYRELLPVKDGQVAGYIPQLARVDPDQLAIAVCTVDGQRFSIGDSAAAFCLQLAGGRRPGFNNAVYLSERQTADCNFALGYSMRESGAFRPGTDLLTTLEFYFQACSIEVDADMLAVAAASLANAGVCPLTDDPVFTPGTVQSCLSLMSSCGMYDFSGEFAFTIGLPAKSGVSGALMLVVPGLVGICIWSPRLDEHGNSVRGIEFCRKLVTEYNVHVFDSLVTGAKRDPRRKKNQARTEAVVALTWAASQGDLDEVRALIATGIQPGTADYDGRTPLHLAAAEGQIGVVRYLLAAGADPEPIDRWGGTPLSDAEANGHTQIAKLLAEAAPKKEEVAI